MAYIYHTHGTCSQQIAFELNGDVVEHIRISGGCPGNTAALQALASGLTVGEIESKCHGILCGDKGTSCPDQLARAVRAAYDAARDNR